MANYRLRFHLKRVVTCFIAAESEEDIDNFMTENPDFQVLDDYPELVEDDESSYDQDSEVGDYELTEDNSVHPMFKITPGLSLVEIDE